MSTNVIIAIARRAHILELAMIYWTPTRHDIHTLRINCYAVTSKAKVRSVRVIQFVPHPMKREIYLHKTRCRQGSKPTIKKVRLLQCQNLHLEFAVVRLIRKGVGLKLVFCDSVCATPNEEKSKPPQNTLQASPSLMRLLQFIMMLQLELTAVEKGWG